ncbi:MAG: phosphoribosylformylglycinamidine synthase subunit PurL [Candidatus Aureabacteria bacterium]|nr:phosphoribosylformylglycinamidine synthase subunit PurL [Candidatus Auribacterota bacterium]
MYKDQPVTDKLVEEHGISPEEHVNIKKMLGNREMNFTELGLFSVMWSEHCSYKNSKPLLKTLPNTGDNILVGAGEENAGVIDIGDGWAISFKIESHNHPSAIEPFQGAATGVGGIIRDIFTMGAKPIAVMDSLRFGDPSKPRTKWLANGVVAGIAHYGNCIGLPTIAGETFFDSSYETNPLVNAFCLGILRHEHLAKGAATGVGNPVFYVGAATGRDGIHGATFASEDLDDSSEERRSAVQVGDPFMEKLLMEACLELLKTGAVVGIQDMGAAGLACSCSETASRGNAGTDVDLSLVPQREEGMIPYEILCSESQERMLVIVKKGREKEVNDIFEKWDLHAVQIGTVIDGEKMIVRNNGEIVADVKAKDLTDNVPEYTRKVIEADYFSKLKEQNDKDIEKALAKNNLDHNNSLSKLLSSPNIASKHEIYEQYDHMVKTNSTVLPGSDAAVLLVKEADKILAMTTDCNGRYCYGDPFTGAKIAVSEAARNLTCSGATPIAVTNCLNFGNPYNSDVYWQFNLAIKGMSEACIKFDTPVTGGNVSFYNQNPDGAVFPTPVIGMVGLIEKKEHITSQFFKEAGDMIVLLGPVGEELGASEYMNVIEGVSIGTPPACDLEMEYNIQSFCRESIKSGFVSSAHDISEGGLAVSLAECCFSSLGHLGAAIELPYEIVNNTSALFGETQSRIILSIKKDKIKDFMNFSANYRVPFCEIGKVTEEKDLIISAKGKKLIERSINDLFDSWMIGVL